MKNWKSTGLLTTWWRTPARTDQSEDGSGDSHLLPIIAVLACIVLCLTRVTAGGETPNSTGEEIELSGDLTIGDTAYTVGCEVVRTNRECRSLALSIYSGATPIVKMEATRAGDDGPTLQYRGRRYRLEASILRAWGDFVCLTAKDIRSRFRGSRTQREGGKWGWELSDQEILRPGLPAKICFVFPSSEGNEEAETVHFTEVIVWSLAEWNNSFNENLLLHLRVRRKVMHDE